MIDDHRERSIELLAATDWNHSPLGSPETWPEALRNAATLVQVSLMPMWLAWGPQLAMVYNAAYADMSNNFIVPKMIQRGVIDNWDADKARDEAQTQIQAIYDKYKS